MKKIIVAFVGVLGLIQLGCSTYCEAGGENKTKTVSHPFICADLGGGKVCRVNQEGKIIWQYPVRNALDVWQLKDGKVLFNTGDGARIVDKDKKTVWQYKAPPHVELFSVQMLKNGNVLVGETGTCRMLEIDKKGKIQKEIKLQTTTKHSHSQFRICRKTIDGTYLVAFTGERTVREYDSKGKILRNIKVPGGPYVAVRLPNGNTLIACGDGHRLIEIDKKDKIVWQIKENDLPDNPLRFVAGVQRLPNGNTVVCNWGGHGHVGQQPQIFEVTPDKQVVWKIYDNKQFSTIASCQLLDVNPKSICNELR